MAIGRKKLAENIERIRQDIAAAAARARRDVADVRIVAVTKSADAEDIRSAVELGLTDLGESRVQQLIQRAQEIAGWLSRRRKDELAAPTWHMIGHLQRNKVKAVLDVARVIHSLDSLRLAEEIDARAADLPGPVDVMLEVNCSGEKQKFGVAVGAVSHLAEQICTLRGIRVVGLMTMAPLSSDPEHARPTFVRLREIFEEMRKDRMGGTYLRHLSMGMSQDYAVAVEEGATLLRIGTKLFT
jgi:pyridoxal phosphate enzyme (YggS family)